MFPYSSERQEELDATSHEWMAYLKFEVSEELNNGWLKKLRTTTSHNVGAETDKPRLGRVVTSE